MAENNGQNMVTEQVPGTEVKAVSDKKLRIGYVFLSLVPVAIFLVIQTACQMPFFIMASFEAVNNPDAPSDPIDAVYYLMEIFNDKYAVYAYLSYAVIGLVVFGIWYFKSFVKPGPKIKFSQVFGVKSLVAAIAGSLGFFFAINAALTLAEMLIPWAMEEYHQLVELSGLGSDTVITVVYAICLGPILEELVFRGVVFSFLEKSNIKPLFTILITAVLFGFVHMNIVQGVYAAALGIFLGFMRYKYRSIMITILAHIVLNSTGTYGEILLGKFDISDGVYLILGGISLFVIAFSVYLINSDKKTNRSETLNP